MINVKMSKKKNTGEKGKKSLYESVKNIIVKKTLTPELYFSKN